MIRDFVHFWDRQHRENNQLYLTGSPLAHYFAHAGVDRLRWRRHRVVMEIGVGYGHFVHQALAWGHTVIAVDLVRAALDRLNGLEDCRLVLTSELPDAVADGAVDLSVCHLVLQHCDDPMVDFLLRQTVRVLHPITGTASFQFASRLPGVMPPWLQAGVDDGVLFWRTPEDMRGRALAAGAHAVEVSDLVTFPDQQAVGWYFLSFTR